MMIADAQSTTKAEGETDPKTKAPSTTEPNSAPKKTPGDAAGGSGPAEREPEPSQQPT